MNACSIEGCTRPYRAKGYCGGHYNTILRKDQHRVVPCAVCGEPVVKNGPGVKRRSICSQRCRYFLTFGRWPASKELVGPVPRTRVERAVAHTVPAAEPTRMAATWTSGPCAWCGQWFTAYSPGSPALYCSLRCTRRAAQSRRRASEFNSAGSYTWSEVMRIYLAIGGCAYCGEQTDDMQPDHVIPLSRGGSNSITNIVPSCGLCNADKRDLYLHEWYADRERRGLPPRILDPRINHLTDAYLMALTA